MVPKEEVQKEFTHWINGNTYYTILSTDIDPKRGTGPDHQVFFFF